MPKVRVTQKSKTNDKLHPVQDSGSLAVSKVTARDQGHYKGLSGAFVTYCNISCLLLHIPESFPDFGSDVPVYDGCKCTIFSLGPLYSLVHLRLAIKVKRYSLGRMNE